MNYYIDFDNTLYETAKLTTLMLDSIGTTISKEKDLNKDELVKEVREGFNSTYGNIYDFSIDIAKKYDVDEEKVLAGVKNTISNGEGIVFEDARRFIERLRKKDNKIFMLTYSPNANQNYQLNKIIGSGLVTLFDGIIMTKEYKFNLDLNYEDGIFIDDDPRDLNGLFEKKPIRLIRIRKENNKRSKIDMDNNQIEEYESFDDIEI